MSLEWTGERFLPWIREHSTIAYEHLHRYAYVTTFIKDKRVLDLACGEGYGAKMLSSSAAHVIGIDIDAEVIRHASERYGASNLEFLQGSIAAVPVQEDHSFDVIICFEAIEHIDDHDAMLREVKRLLKRGGVFVVSTPNKAIYHDESHDENPFHVKELYFEEFDALLRKHFVNVQFLGQRIHPSSNIWPVAGFNSKAFREFVLQRDSAAEFEFIANDKRIPLYFIAMASDAPADLPLPGSSLIDQSDSLFREKDDATRWREQQVKERDEQIKSLEEALNWRQQHIEGLTKDIEWLQGEAKELRQSIASQEEALNWRAHQVSDLEKARDYWERESANLNSQLQGTQRQLSIASDTLAGIYASRGWKLIMKLRRIRDMFTGRGKSRA
jgi:ubiquinone/menaquinone biosynthesis C-methylase UbiE